jgi:LytS/YehU family sensor histidine kinase
METDASRQLDDVQRYRLEVYRSQAMPVWAWPAFGVGVFVFVSSYELQESWVGTVVALACTLFFGLWVGLLIQRSGVQPRLRGMPGPLFGEVLRGWVTGLLLMGAAFALGFVVSFVLAGALTGIVMAVSGRRYERRARRRADALVAALPTRGQ